MAAGLISRRFELSVLQPQCLNRRIPDIGTLRRETEAWEQERNNRGSKTQWRFTTADSRIKLKRLYPKLNVILYQQGWKGAEGESIVCRR